MYICIYVYIYTHIHTHTYTCVQASVADVKTAPDATEETSLAGLRAIDYMIILRHTVSYDTLSNAV